MATTTIRLHSYTTVDGVEPHTGIDSCDFRGEHFVGKADGDGHKTLVEFDVDENHPAVAAALEHGPAMNRGFRAIFDAQVSPNDDDLVPCLRIGVWSKKAEDGS